MATNSGDWYEHPLFSSRIVRTDLISFIKPFKIILTKRFVLIKFNRNFNHKYDDQQFKYKLARLVIWGRIVQVFCSFFFCFFFLGGGVLWLWLLSLLLLLLLLLLFQSSSNYSKDDFSHKLENYQSYSNFRVIFWKGRRGFVAYTNF